MDGERRLSLSTVAGTPLGGALLPSPILSFPIYRYIFVLVLILEPTPSRRRRRHLPVPRNESGREYLDR